MAVTGDAPQDRGEYCRRIEGYLCQKNGGHLIRLVGPAFETVRTWADTGVPYAIACQGIDRYCERHAARSGRKRPVQIQFCEADVLDVFDDWRRAVGVPRSAPGGADGGSEGDTADTSRHGSLAAHLERAIARLTMLRGGHVVGDELIDAVVRELDGIRASAKGLRGAARNQCLDRLRELDASLLTQARAGLSESALTEVDGEAARELAPFRDRLPADAYQQSVQVAVDRLIRARLRLPVVAFD